MLSDFLRQRSGPASSVLLSEELQSFMITLVASRDVKVHPCQTAGHGTDG